MRNVTPHVAQNITEHRGSAVDGRTTRHAGYDISQRFRKRIEEIFGWTKTVGELPKDALQGPARTELASYFVGAAYNLLRISRLQAASAPDRATPPALDSERQRPAQTIKSVAAGLSEGFPQHPARASMTSCASPPGRSRSPRARLRTSSGLWRVPPELRDPPGLTGLRTPELRAGRRHGPA